MSGRSEKTAILFVDDDAQFRQILASSFQRKGYRVFTAACGHEALEVIQKNAIDVVVSDIRMPNGSGIDLLDQTKGMAPQMPVILLVTGFADIATEEAYLRGAEALLSKPFKMSVLEEIIEQHLSQGPKSQTTDRQVGQTVFKAELTFRTEEGTIPSEVLSLGDKGMFVVFEGKCPAINDEVMFEIIKDDKKLKGSGIIRWIRTHEMHACSGLGVEFLSVFEE